MITSLQAADTKLEEIKSSQQTDPTYKQLTQFCLNGWPCSNQVSRGIKHYQSVSSKLSVQEDLLMRNGRIVISKLLQAETLQAIRNGHQGITKC